MIACDVYGLHDHAFVNYYTAVLILFPGVRHVGAVMKTPKPQSRVAPIYSTKQENVEAASRCLVCDALYYIHAVIAVFSLPCSLSWFTAVSS